MRRHPPALRIADGGALGDAEQHILRLVHARIGEEHIVGGDQRQVPGIGQLDQRPLDLVLLVQEVPLQLDIEPVGKQSLEPAQHGLRIAAAPLQQQPAHAALQAPGERDQAFRPSLHVVQGDLRCLLAGTVEEGLADQAHQIAVAGLVLGNQGKLVRQNVAPADHPQSAPLGIDRAPDVELHADDRLHALARGRHREFQRAEHIAAVGHRDRRHAVLLRQLHQLLGVNRPLRQGIGGMHTEMDEIGVGHAGASGGIADLPTPTRPGHPGRSNRSRSPRSARPGPPSGAGNRRWSAASHRKVKSNWISLKFYLNLRDAYVFFRIGALKLRQF